MTTAATLFGPITPEPKQPRKQPRRLDEPFAAIPIRVLKADIPAAALKLYAILRDYARASDSCWPGQDRLAALVGCTVRHVRRLIAALQRCNLVAVARRGLGLTNRYALLPAEGASTGQECPIRADIDVRSERTSLSAPSETEKEQAKKTEAEGEAAAAIAPLVAVGVAPANAAAWVASQPLLEPLEAVQCWQRACYRRRRQNRPEPHPVAFLAGLYRDPAKYNFAIVGGKLIEAKAAVPKPSQTPMVASPPSPIVQELAESLRRPAASVVMRSARPEPDRSRPSPAVDAWSQLPAAERERIMTDERRHGLAGFFERCLAAARRLTEASR